MVKLSIVIPVLNEADTLARQLEALQWLRRRGHEVILVDGGSIDGSQALGSGLADLRLTAPQGRALQMNAGASFASGDVILFLHVDTSLPDGAASLVEKGLAGQRDWGRFDVRLDGPGWPFRLIEWSMNWRSRLTGVATGDQAIFVRRATFERIGGFAELPLMEDVELSKRLRKQSWPACVRVPVVTSSRRWERHGILRTMLTMWCLRLLYLFGASPGLLNRIYYK